MKTTPKRWYGWSRTRGDQWMTVHGPDTLEGCWEAVAKRRKMCRLGLHMIEASKLVLPEGERPWLEEA